MEALLYRTIRRSAVAIIATLAALVTAACDEANGPVPPASSTTTPAGASADPRPEAPPDGPEPGGQGQPLDGHTAQEIREASLTVPPWPTGHGDDGHGDNCQAGEYEFAGGSALIEQGTDYGNTWAYEILPDEGQGIVANVDGSEGDELLVTIGCGGSELHFGLLALAPDGSGFRTLGYVMAGTGIVDGPDQFSVEGDEIVVESDPGQGTEQQRRYRWDGTQFVQVG
jgi:hypothetical protein